MIWKTWTVTWKRLRLNSYLIPYTKLNSKWNIRLETKNLLEESISSNLVCIGFGNDTLDLIPQKEATKAKIKQAGLHQMKKLLHSKGNNQQNERELYWMGESICKSYLIKDNVPKYICMEATEISIRDIWTRKIHIYILWNITQWKKRVKSCYL